MPSPYPTKDSKFDRTSGTILKNGQDAPSTRDEFSCGTGILPVQKRLIENGATSQFDRIIYAKTAGGEIDWIDAFQQLENYWYQTFGDSGRGKTGSVCAGCRLGRRTLADGVPLILGGADAPTAVEGKGFLADLAPKLELLAVKQVGQEVFLHYRVDRWSNRICNIISGYTGII